MVTDDVEVGRTCRLADTGENDETEDGDVGGALISGELMRRLSFLTRNRSFLIAKSQTF